LQIIRGLKRIYF